MKIKVLGCEARERVLNDCNNFSEVAEAIAQEQLRDALRQIVEQIEPCLAPEDDWFIIGRKFLEELKKQSEER